MGFPLDNNRFIPYHIKVNHKRFLSMTKQRYGWYSAEAAKKYGYSTYRSIDSKTDIDVTNVIHSATDPGDYKWPDAVCLGPVGECIKMRNLNTSRLCYEPKRYSWDEWTVRSARKTYNTPPEIPTEEWCVDNNKINIQGIIDKLKSWLKDNNNPLDRS